MNQSTISLYELNNLIKGILSETLPHMLWIRAEMSDVRVNQNGHCYLEFIEKDASNKTIVAKARAMIWANTFYMLKAHFENSTKQSFRSGLKVLVKVSVEFHELYGYSLTIHDIDPSYTLGDQALNRAAVLKQLEEEGVIDLNKELDLPLLTNRIAIISSPTAAGYEDFLDQLNQNPYGFIFYTKLFPAIMQGDKAEDSIISALEKIYDHLDSFDAVIIIRGGGATSDLSCFDSYLLAANCAQFPLPIITGIGHERDETVLDIVAHTRAKTPTAVAEFLIGHMTETALLLEEISKELNNSVSKKLQEELLLLNTYETQAVFILKNWYKEQSAILSSIKDFVSRNALRIEKNSTSGIAQIESDLKRNTQQLLKNEQDKLNSIDKHLELLSPLNILKKGYTITLKEGQIVKNSDSLKLGETITTLFADGQVKSTIKE